VAVVVMFNGNLVSSSKGDSTEESAMQSDAVNLHFQFGGHNQGINQFALISIITLKNY
jgi:hypothetical protein